MISYAFVANKFIANYSSLSKIIQSKWMRAFIQIYWVLTLIFIYCVFWFYITTAVYTVLFIGNIETGKKEGKILCSIKADRTKSKGHTGHVLCLAVTSDNKYLVRTVWLECLLNYCKCNLSGLTLVLEQNVKNVISNIRSLKAELAQCREHSPFGIIAGVWSLYSIS